MFGKRDSITKWAKSVKNGDRSFPLEAIDADGRSYDFRVTAQDGKIQSIVLHGLKLTADGLDRQTAEIELDTALGLLALYSSSASELGQLAAEQNIPMPTGFMGLPDPYRLRGLFCAAVMLHPQGPPAAAEQLAA